MSLWPRIPWFEERARNRALGQQIYAAIVAQARNEALYLGLAVPDTVHGRFEMIVAHLALVLGRLQSGDDAEPEAGRAMLEAFVADMDDTCRRLGIGDMGVPRHVKKAAAAVIERGQTYAVAMSHAPTPEGDPLAEVLVGHVWGGSAPEDHVSRGLAAYLRSTASAVSELSVADIVAGKLNFPDPVAVASGSSPGFAR